MKKQQINEQPLERELQIEGMRRYLQAKPEEASAIALEIFETYLSLNAQYLALNQKHLQLQQRVRTRIETPPFFK